MDTVSKIYLLGSITLRNESDEQCVGNLYVRYLSPVTPVLVVELVESENDKDYFVAVRTNRISSEGLHRYCIQASDCNWYFYFSDFTLE